MKIDDLQQAINQIKIDIKERLHHYFSPTDHSFALQNYEYLTKTLENKAIVKIYKQLGPFDFYQNGFKVESDEASDMKAMQEKYEKRRSGAMFRGEISQTSGKPEGRGIKIFPNGSIFEGYFSDGHTHGIGRGVTSRGEVYQGFFVMDQMEGIGFF